MNKSLILNLEVINSLINETEFMSDYESSVSTFKNKESNYSNSHFDIVSYFNVVLNNLEKIEDGSTQLIEIIKSYVSEQGQMEQKKSDIISEDSVSETAVKEEIETLDNETEGTYTVKSGDTLWSIASKCVEDANDNVAIQTMIGTIIALNGLKSGGSLIYPNQELKIPGLSDKVDNKTESTTTNDKETLEQKESTESNDKSDTISTNNATINKAENSTNNTAQNLSYSESVVFSKYLATDADYRVTTNNNVYNLSNDDVQLLTAIVAQEAAGTNTSSEALAITSTILNRYENGGYGDNVIEVATSGAYSAYTDTNYLKYMPGGSYYGSDKYAIVAQAVKDALAGTRNLPKDYFYFAGNGVNNVFRNIYQ